MKRILLVLCLCAVIMMLFVAPAFGATMHTRMAGSQNNLSTGFAYFYMCGSYYQLGQCIYSWSPALGWNYGNYDGSVAGINCKIHLHYRDGHWKWYGPFKWNGSSMVTVPSS